MKTRQRRGTKSIDSKIEKARKLLEKVEARRDKVAQNLRVLMDRRDEIRRQEIVDAIGTSRRCYDEILNFIKS